MKNINKLNLTEADSKFLTRFAKIVEKIYIYYFMVGVAFCTGIIGVILFIKTNNRSYILMSLVFFGIATNLFFLASSYRRLHSVINAMNEYILSLESQVRSTPTKTGQANIDVVPSSCLSPKDKG